MHQQRNKNRFNKLLHSVKSVFIDNCIGIFHSFYTQFWDQLCEWISLAIKFESHSKYTKCNTRVKKNKVTINMRKKMKKKKKKKDEERMNQWNIWIIELNIETSSFDHIETIFETKQKKKRKISVWNQIY